MSHVRHAEWCNEPTRLESYSAQRYGDDGTTVVARPRVVRCITCGSQTVDGQPVEG